MVKRRLIILVLLAVPVRYGGWTGVRCCVPGACTALGRSGRLLGYWAFAFSLYCTIMYVASYMGGGGSRGLWGGGIIFAWVFGLGMDILGADWCIGVGDGSLLSFFLLS